MRFLLPFLLLASSLSGQTVPQVAWKLVFADYTTSHFSGGVTAAAQSMVNVGDTLTADCKFWAAANTNITLVWTFAGTTAPTVSAKTIMLSYGS